MRINNIVFCESAQMVPLPQGGAMTVLTKPLPEIEIEFIPGLYSMTLSFGVSGIPKEGFQTIKVQIVDPEGKPVFSSESSSEDAGIPKEAFLGSITVCMDMRNVRILQEGEYTVVIAVNDVSRTEYISVRKKDIQ